MMLAVIKREFLIAARRKSDALNPLLFFLIVITLFPLGLGPEGETLALVAPGVLWVVALLACLLSMDSVFRSDFDDGTLEVMLLSPASLYLQVLAKVLSHWLLTGLPLTVFSPVLSGMMQMPAHGITAMVLSLALGTFCLSFIGAVGAALTVGLRRGGLLLALLILPLYVPVLIFGSSAVQAAVDGFTYAGQLAVLGGFAMLALGFAPLAIAGGLRISVDQ